MHKNLAIASCVLLAGCAAAGTRLPATASSFQPVGGAAPAASLSHVENVDVNAAARDDGFVCVTEAPTGSRIARKRCYIRDAEHEQRMEREAHEYVDALRRQQMFEEMARQQMEQERAQRAQRAMQRQQ